MFGCAVNPFKSYLFTIVDTNFRFHLSTKTKRSFEANVSVCYKDYLYLQIRGKILNATARSTRLNHLTPGSRYIVCVLAIGNIGSATSESSIPDARIATSPEITNMNSIYGDERTMNHLRLYMNDSMTSKCTTVSTIEIFGAALDSPLSNTYMGIADILTRRLSLVVGCCIGFIVFVVLVSALGYIKTKKRQVVIKTDAQQAPQYISYDNFNTPSVEVQTTDMDINTITDKSKPQCKHD